MDKYDYNLAIDIINNYIDNLPKPKLNLKKAEFFKRSQFIWAASELMCRIYEEECQIPEHICGRERKNIFEITDSFIEKMDNYYFKFKKKKDIKDIKDIKDMFKSAKTVGRITRLLFFEEEAYE